jgi:dimethylhistidine N-methyltransferase
MTVHMRAVARQHGNPAQKIPAPERQDAAAHVAFAEDVVVGLSACPKQLPAKYFYDARGSELFEEITALPEYYPTRTEMGILRENAADIAGHLPDRCALIEFGAGASTKVRLLLAASARVDTYVPVDISADFLAREAGRLEHDFPHLRVLPIAADFTHPFALPAEIAAMPRAGFFPGSTLGNFEPHEASRFLANTAQLLGVGACLVIGIDLVKDPEILRAAYNDAAGVTAAFNLNLLHRMNIELGGDFDPDAFSHYALFNRDKRRIEMHLASRVAQRVRVCGHSFDFRRGETIHTENSYKYTIDSFHSLAAGAGWRAQAVWTDSDQYFSVHALVHVPD